MPGLIAMERYGRPHCHDEFSAESPTVDARTLLKGIRLGGAFAGLPACRCFLGSSCRCFFWCSQMYQARITERTATLSAVADAFTRSHAASLATLVALLLGFATFSLIAAAWPWCDLFAMNISQTGYALPGWFWRFASHAGSAIDNGLNSLRMDGRSLPGADRGLLGAPPW